MQAEHSLKCTVCYPAAADPEDRTCVVEYAPIWDKNRKKFSYLEYGEGQNSHIVSYRSSSCRCYATDTI